MESRRPSSHPAVPPGDSAEARDRIVAVARRSFLAQGFSRFTMDELARELGMSKKTLYAHFATKDALVEAVLEAKIADFRAAAQAIAADTAIQPAQRAHRLFGQVVSQMSEVSPLFLRDLERFLPGLHRRVEQVRRETLPVVWGRLVQDGIERGEIRADVRVPFVVEMVLHAVQGLLRPEVLERLQIAPHEVVRGVLSTVFSGLLTPAGRKVYENNPAP